MQQGLQHMDIEKSAKPKVELTISTEKAGFIIAKAREFDMKAPPTELEPETNPPEEPEDNALEEYPDDPTYTELRDAISALNADEKADLVALTWVGRGDYGPEEWQQARKLALSEQHHTADYLAGTPLLVDLLEDGLEALGYPVEDFENSRR